MYITLGKQIIFCTFRATYLHKSSNKRIPVYLYTRVSALNQPVYTTQETPYKTMYFCSNSNLAQKWEVDFKEWDCFNT